MKRYEITFWEGSEDAYAYAEAFWAENISEALEAAKKLSSDEIVSVQLEHESFDTPIY